jgi:hypothetical protein
LLSLPSKDALVVVFEYSGIPAHYGRILLTTLWHWLPAMLQIIFDSSIKKIFTLKFTIMKKCFFSGLTGIFLLLITAITAHGQLASVNVEPSEDNISSGKLPANSISIDRGHVNSRVLKTFRKTFDNVSGEKWYQLQIGFVALFNRDGIKYQVAYGKNTNWLYTIRTYDESKLPADVRSLVKSTYYDYNITLVQEIDRDPQTFERELSPLTYLIHMEGKNSLVIAKVCDGEMQEWRKFKKSE